jgi:Fe-S-cluster containining protein
MKEFNRLENSAEDPLQNLWQEFKALIALIDDAYKKAALHYGFICEGCEENCCLTRFNHHTYLEFFHLKNAFEALDGETRQKALKRAERVVRVHAEAGKKKDPARIMCPLNVEGRCVVYESRPMICRLHGIPSELHPPGKPGSVGPVITPGCEWFTRKFEKRNYHSFDRTPFYLKLAALEKEFRKQTGLKQKIKMTVAQIILCDPQSLG